jgi:tripartite-type tricarboxylate transporter receptor subunit TctC
VPPLPDLPTLNELGCSQIEADNWYGMVATAVIVNNPAVLATQLTAAGT